MNNQYCLDFKANNFFPSSSFITYFTNQYFGHSICNVPHELISGSMTLLIARLLHTSTRKKLIRLLFQNNYNPTLHSNSRDPTGK